MIKNEVEIHAFLLLYYVGIDSFMISVTKHPSYIQTVPVNIKLSNFPAII